MKPTFFERTAAYLIDFLIVSIIISIVCFGLPVKNTEEYENKLNEMATKITNSEIKEEEYQEYIEEYGTILYDIQKSNIVQTGVTAALTIGYFVIFQYLNKGQTLGKKLLKLRVVDKDNQKPVSIIKGLIRSLFIVNIVSGIFNIILIYIINKSNYYIGYATVSGIELLFIFITIILVLYRKDGRGLHDMMANTTVIKEGR